MRVLLKFKTKKPPRTVELHVLPRTGETFETGTETWLVTHVAHSIDDPDKVATVHLEIIGNEPGRV